MYIQGLIPRNSRESTEAVPIGQKLNYYLFYVSGYLEKLTSAIVSGFHFEKDKALKKDYLKVITKPFTKLIVQVRKNTSGCLFKCGSRGEYRGSGPLPLENHKNIVFLSNSGPDPLKNHKATKLAFNVGPSSARQRNAI